MQSHVLESLPPREEGCHLCRIPFKSAPKSGSEDQAWPMLWCHETKVIVDFKSALGSGHSLSLAVNPQSCRSASWEIPKTPCFTAFMDGI